MALALLPINPVTGLCRLGATLAVLVLLTVGAVAEPLPIVAGMERIEVLPAQLALLEDPAADLSIDQVMTAWQAGEFSEDPDLDLNLGTSGSAFWARLVLSNPGDVARRVVLTHDYPPTDDVQLFLIDNNIPGLQLYAGDSWPVSAGNRRTPAFALQLPAGGEQLAFLRVQTASNLNFELSLWPPLEYQRYERTLSLRYGLLFGAIIATAVYLLFVWLLGHYPTALMFAAYLLSYGSYLSYLIGFSANWYLPYAAGMINALHMTALGSLFGFGALFYRGYLRLADASPEADRLVAALQWMGFAIILSPILPRPILALLTLVVVGIGPLVTTGLAYYLWLKKRQDAGVFALGWTVAHLSALLGALRVTGLLPNSEFLMHLPAFGCALAFLFLAWAFAQRLARDRIYAYQDPLTGLANRRRFERQIGFEFSRASRYGRPLSLVLLDVDDFKGVNDSQGHSFGDRVLQSLAHRCEEHFRSTDLIARIGGDEFAIVLVETQLEEARKIAQRLLTTQSEAEDEGTTVTISIGISEVKVGDSISSELLDRADEALYKAKHAGRNQVICLPENGAEPATA
ncbi:MAG: diguanylate cyclase [Halieaceae bacterium]